MQKKIIAITSIACASMLFSGCQQEELSTTPATQQEERGQSAVEKLVKTSDRVQEKVDDAVAQQNAKNEEAKKILEEDTAEQQINDNSMSQKTMENIPAEINMEFAQTCKGATIKTNKGEFELKFYGEDAPVTVANFCTLTDKRFYDGVIFHRVIKDFMIQGGDPEGTGTGGPGYQFDDEIHTNNKNMIGTISMANAGPGTNGSQFFINTKDNNFLDTKHTVFGEVVSGMEVITVIEETETGAMDRPVEDIVIESVTLIQ